MFNVKLILFYIILPVLLLTGCSDLVEVQNRDFVLAMGVSISDGQYEIIFANPDFEKDTKQEGSDGEKRVGSYKSSFMSEIESMYNFSSDKRLDYRHLEVIILDKSIAGNADMLFEFTEYIKSNYEFSRNVILFYYSGDIADIFEKNIKSGKSIGDYLKMLDENNQKKYSLKPVTIGNLMTGFSEDQVVVIPRLEIMEDIIKINGGAVFNNGVCENELSKEEILFYHIANGEGKEYVIYAMEDVPASIKKVKSKVTFEYVRENPKIFIEININAEPMGADKGIEDQELSYCIEEYLESSIGQLIMFYMKEDKIDLLKLYDKSAVKNKALWIDYQERCEDFVSDAELFVNAKVKMK